MVLYLVDVAVDPVLRTVGLSQNLLLSYIVSSQTCPVPSLGSSFRGQVFIRVEEVFHVVKFVVLLACCSSTNYSGRLTWRQRLTVTSHWLWDWDETSISVVRCAFWMKAWYVRSLRESSLFNTFAKVLIWTMIILFGNCVLLWTCVVRPLSRIVLLLWIFRSWESSVVLKCGFLNLHTHLKSSKRYFVFLRNQVHLRENLWW